MTERITWYKSHSLASTGVRHRSIHAHFTQIIYIALMIMMDFVINTHANPPTSLPFFAARKSHILISTRHICAHMPSSFFVHAWKKIRWNKTEAIRDIYSAWLEYDCHLEGHYMLHIHIHTAHKHWMIKPKTLSSLWEQPERWVYIST